MSTQACSQPTTTTITTTTTTTLFFLLFLTFLLGFCMLFCIYELYTSGAKEIALLGTELCAVTLIFLLIGQRLAKDYAGAMSLAVYFIITLWGVFLLNS